jgi:predicted NBD/HSP70 family sugar kinase
MCGATGCWEAYISNLATLSRYFGWNLSKISPKSLRDTKQNSFTVQDVIARARGGDAKAIAAIQSTARFLGLGLSTVVNVINPGSIYLAGEITTAWDLIESTVREAMGERALTEAAAQTPLRVASAQDQPRLRGAAALIAAPTFAAPRVA